MIMSYLVEVGKQSAGLFVANAGLDKGHVSRTQRKHRCRPVGYSYEHRPPARFRSPQHSGILKSVMQV